VPYVSVMVILTYKTVLVDDRTLVDNFQQSDRGWDPSQTTSESATRFGVSDKTILIHLNILEKRESLKNGHRIN
jgi:hypothetical protein